MVVVSVMVSNSPLINANNGQVDLHKQLTLPAWHAKKDVLVEWLLGNELQESQELATLAQKQRVKIAAALQARLLPSVRKVRLSTYLCQFTNREDSLHGKQKRSSTLAL